MLVQLLRKSATQLLLLLLLLQSRQYPLPSLSPPGGNFIWNYNFSNGQFEKRNIGHLLLALLLPAHILMSIRNHAPAQSMTRFSDIYTRSKQIRNNPIGTILHR